MTISTEVDVVGSAALPDVVVVIDVIRAFTTVSALFSLGATEVVCKRDYAEAAADFDALLVGESESDAAMPGVIPSSPSRLSQHCFRSRRVALFTLNGTRMLLQVPPGPVLMAGAASNVTATANWILTHVKDHAWVNIVISDPAGPEDRACAHHLELLLRGLSADPVATSRRIRSARQAHWARWGASVDADEWRFFEDDVELCAVIDTFHSAAIVEIQADRRRTIRPDPPVRG